MGIPKIKTQDALGAVVLVERSGTRQEFRQVWHALRTSEHATCFNGHGKASVFRDQIVQGGRIQIDRIRHSMLGDHLPPKTQPFHLQLFSVLSTEC